MKKAIIMLSLALVSWGAYAQHQHGNHDHHAHQEEVQSEKPEFENKKIGAAYDHYIHLKNALVNSKSEEANNAAVALTVSLKEVDKGQKATNAAGKVASAGSLREQRKAFTALSNEMVALVKASKLKKGEVYVEFCPMANANAGGTWLSSEKEIKNPYFGDKMLKCGKVKEVLN